MFSNKKKLLLYPVVWLPVLVTLFVCICLLCFSFWPSAEIDGRYGALLHDQPSEGYAVFSLFPEQWTIEQFRTVLLARSDYWFYFWNTIRMTLPSCLLSLLVSVPAGYALSFFVRKNRKLLVLLLSLAMIPTQLLVSPQLMQLMNFGLYGKSESVVLIAAFSPFSVYLIERFSEEIPGELFEAANLDGAGKWNTFRWIALPALKNGMLAALLLSLIDSWSMVEQPMAFLDNSFEYPLSLAVLFLEEDARGTLFAAVVTFTIPILLMFRIGKTALADGLERLSAGE